MVTFPLAASVPMQVVSKCQNLKDVLYAWGKNCDEVPKENVQKDASDRLQIIIPTTMIGERLTSVPVTFKMQLKQVA